MKKDIILVQYKKCERAAIALSKELQLLARMASSIMGEELDVNICNGNEIEFRHEGDAFDTICIGDILSKLEREG